MSKAEAALREYWILVNVLYQTSGRKYADLEELVSEERWKDAVETAELTRDNGWVQEGRTRFDSVRLISYERQGQESVTIAVCLDYTERTFYDSEGFELESPDPRPRIPFEYHFERAEDELILVHSDQISGDGC